MGGEHSAFRSLVPSSAAAFLAASASLGLTRGIGGYQHSSSPSPHPSDMSDDDEEINVHEDESDCDEQRPRVPAVHKSNSVSAPLQLTTHDRQ